MAAAATPATPAQMTKPNVSAAVPFDLSQPPIIDGFTRVSRIKEETFKEKFLRKGKENPFVPLGCVGTMGVLLLGLRACYQQKTQQSQMLMRARVIAQGFTVVASIVGVFAATMRKK